MIKLLIILSLNILQNGMFCLSVIGYDGWFTALL